MIPLERYFASLMPLAKEISVFRKPPRLKVFDEQEFLKIISNTPSKIPKSNFNNVGIQKKGQSQESWKNYTSKSSVNY